MRAVLEFNLPEDTDEHQLALDAWKWRKCVNDLDEEMRTLSKYHNLVDIPIDRVRKKISELIDELGLELYV